MSDGFDRYVAWLDFADHDRAPGYYGLLKLATFEADLDRIGQAIFQETLDVSNFLKGPQRGLAEAVLEELTRAENCLTNPASKAAYDARLRASLGDTAETSDARVDGPQDEEPTALTPTLEAARSELAIPPEEGDSDAEDVIQPGAVSGRALVADAPTPVAADHAPRPRAPAAKSSGPNSAASAADRSVWAAIEQAKRRSSDDSGKKARIPNAQPASLPAAASQGVLPQGPTQTPNSETISLSSAIAQSLAARIPAPLVKHPKRIAVAVMLLVGLGFVAQLTTAALDKPRPPRVRVQLDPEEELMFSQQISVLYNLGNDAATRSAAAEKLRNASPEAIRKFSYYLGDLAGKQPEPEIQQTLRSLAESAGSGS